MKDRAAFDLFVPADQRETLRRLPACLERSRWETEEALQEVFVKIWTKADRFAVSDTEPDLVAGRDRAQSFDRPYPGTTRAAVDGTEAAMESRRSERPSPEAMAVAGGENERIYTCLEELEKDRAAAVRGTYLDGGKLCRAGVSPQRAAEHHAYLAAPQPDEAEGMPRDDDACGRLTDPTWTATTLLAAEYVVGRSARRGKSGRHRARIEQRRCLLPASLMAGRCISRRLASGYLRLSRRPTAAKAGDRQPPVRKSSTASPARGLGVEPPAFGQPRLLARPGDGGGSCAGDLRRVSTLLRQPIRLRPAATVFSRLARRRQGSDVQLPRCLSTPSTGEESACRKSPASPAPTAFTNSGW